MRFNEHGLWPWCDSCQGKPRPEGRPACHDCAYLRRRFNGKPSWPGENFDEHSELTKERDGERADAEAARYRR